MRGNCLLRSVCLLIVMIPLFLGGEETAVAPTGPAVEAEPVPQEEASAAPKETPPPLVLFSAEEQISFDAEGKIRVIDSGLRTRFGLFPEVVGFKQALLFKRGETFELAITTEKEGATTDVRIALSAEQADALRARITAANAPVAVIAPQPKEAPVAAPAAVTTAASRRSVIDEEEADGFAPFLAYTALWSGGYGLLMPYIFGGEDTHWAYYPGVSLLTAGGGFAAAYFLGRDAYITRGMAFASAEGAFRGGVDGVNLFWLIAGSLYMKDHEHGDAHLKNDIGLDNETYGRLMAASAMLFSMGEYALGLWYASSHGLTGGESRILGVGSLLGYVTMLELSATIFDGLYAGDRSATRIIPAMMLAGGVGGLFLGHAANSWDHYTEGDASLIQTSVALGTYLPITIAVAARSLDARVYAGVSLLGTVGGAVGGYYLLKGLDFSNMDAFIIDLGTLAGGLTTAGIAVLAAMKTDQWETVHLASSIGTLGGFALMYYLYREKGLRQAEGNERTSWRFQLNPVGIATALSAGRPATPNSEEDLRILRETPAAPIASFEYRW
ncbi:MAG TPA: hypothetical protein PLV42_08860 [bacterium]|nr:hypothetical protein [bacterium]